MSDKQRDLRALRVRVWIEKEPGGGFSAYAADLPGCTSCGEEFHETLHNVAEAARAVIETHMDAGEDIPWLDLKDRRHRPLFHEERYVQIKPFSTAKPVTLTSRGTPMDGEHIAECFGDAWLDDFKAADASLNDSEWERRGYLTGGTRAKTEPTQHRESL